MYTARTIDESIVTYSLSEDSDSALEIDSSTGEVTLAENPDQELKDNYSFSVIATDTSNNEEIQSVTLNIMI